MRTIDRRAQVALMGAVAIVLLPMCNAEPGGAEPEHLALSRAALAPELIATNKVCQLTGAEDRGENGSSPGPTGMVRGGGHHGITGTDIGWSFEHQGDLHFMFGDTRDFSPDRCDPGSCGVAAQPNEPPLPALTADGLWPNYTNPDPEYLYDPAYYWDYLDTHSNSAESWASVPLAEAEPSQCLSLRVATEGQSFRQTKLNGRSLPRQEGGFSGFSDGQSIFGFFTQKAWPEGCAEATGCAHDANDPNDPNHVVPGGKTSIAFSSDNGATFEQIAHFSTKKFQFVAPSVVARDQIPAPLPPELGEGERIVTAFGAGRVEPNGTYIHWNQSFPYLALSDLERVQERAPAVAGVSAFSHTISGKPFVRMTISSPIPHQGASIGLAKEDRLVLGYQDKVLVVRTDGSVQRQLVGATTIGAPTTIPARTLADGSPVRVGTGPLDRHVLSDAARNRLLVITTSGEVWAHPITTHIEAPYQLTTAAPISARAEDNHVLVVGNRIVVITKRGRVYGHQFSPDGNTLGIAALLADSIPGAGTTPPFTPTARWVTAYGDHIVVIEGTGAGRLYKVHPSQNSVYPAQVLNGDQQVGWSDHTRWLVPIKLPDGQQRLLTIAYKPTSWLYFAGMADDTPTFTVNESDAAPLWPVGHECLGYYSVRYLGHDVLATPKWVMLYTCAQNTVRGVYMRSAPAPWGPWSNATRVLINMDPEIYPNVPEPYGRWMYLPASDPRDNGSGPYEDEKRKIWAPPGGLSWAVREPGGEYAPFLLPSRYATTAGSDTTLYYTLSTWNPYQTILMSLKVKLD